MTIKNKELLKIIRERAARMDCENCKFCNLRNYYRGEWPCNNPEVSVFDWPIEIEKCFVRK